MKLFTKSALSGALMAAVSLGTLQIYAGPEQDGVLTNAEQITKAQKQLEDLSNRTKMIWAKIDSAGAGGPNEAQAKELDQIDAEFGRLEQVIARRQKVEEQTASMNKGTGRKVSAGVDASNGDRSVAASAIDRDDFERHGFQAMGHFAMAVVEAAKAPANADSRLTFSGSESSFNQAGSGQDGGYLIPPAFMREIYQKVRIEDSLLPRTNNVSSDSDVAVWPVNEDAPWLSQGGVRSYWVGEGEDITRSKAQLKNKTMELHEIATLVFATNKSLRNASLLGSFIRNEAPKSMNFEITDAIVDGDGVAKPRGILRSPSKIQVAKESGQGNGTILYQNIVKMWSRLYAPLRGDAVWLINQEIEPQLELMEFPTTTGATAVPVYMPANGAADTPFARLKGRPVIPVQSCKALGLEGDIILTSLKEYLTITPSGGIEDEVSGHLAFDQALTAFRFMWSVYGDSWWSKSLSPKNGSNTLSNIVTLAPRVA